MLKNALPIAALALVLATGLLESPVARADSPLVSNEPTGAVMAVDGLVVRPLGIVSTVLGVATWVVTLPFTLIGGNADEAGEVLVADPAQFTFVRPLGEF